MNLIIDIGNTKQKIALVEEGSIIYFETFSKIKLTSLEFLFSSYNITKAIISNVRSKEDVVEMVSFVSSKIPMYNVNELKKIPIQNNYNTPETLGNDRLAVAVGSRVVFNRENTLVVQIGTCITYDFIDKNSIYHGGAISPGCSMRLKSLHHFTKKLPLVTQRNFFELIGKNTEESILAGVYQGITSEIDGIIEKYKLKYNDLRIIMTGGGINNFEKLLKNKIFAVPNLVIIGLNHLLEIHESK